MNLLFFLTPKQDVLYIYEDFTLRQTLEKWSNQRYATIPVLKRNGEYVGSITEGDILWAMKNLHGLDLEASEDVPSGTTSVWVMVPRNFWPSAMRPVSAQPM